jgi:hypothetical protein
VVNSIYSLVYKYSRRKPKLSIRILSDTATRDFLVIRGKRAAEILKIMITVLDAYAIRYNVVKSSGEDIYELPADVGHASLIFMMMVYSARKPDKHVSLYEKLLAGKIPLSIYLKAFIDIAVELSETAGRTKKQKTILNARVARSLSPIIRDLVELLCKFSK